MSTYIIDLISHLTLRKIGLTRIKALSPPMHSTINRVKCETEILPSVRFECTTSCIRGKRLPARPQNIPATPKLILKYIEVFLCKGTRQKPIGRLNRYSRKFEIVIKQVRSGRLARNWSESSKRLADAG